MEGKADVEETIAFIGGSGLADGLDRVLEDVKTFEDETVCFGKWSDGTPKTGRVLIYHVGRYNDMKVAIIPRHGRKMGDPLKQERTPMELIQEYGHEAHIWKLHELGVSDIYSFSAVGLMDPEVPLADNGVFIVPHDYIAGKGFSQHTFGKEAETIFPVMKEPFSEELRSRVISAIREAGCTALEEGIYICNGGEAFETMAEIRMLDRMTKGEPNRMVGMTAIPEVMLAEQMGIKIATICSGVNYAEGMYKGDWKGHAQTEKVMAIAHKNILQVTKNILEGYVCD